VLLNGTPFTVSTTIAITSGKIACGAPAPANSTNCADDCIGAPNASNDGTGWKCGATQPPQSGGGGGGSNGLGNSGPGGGGAGVSVPKLGSLGIGGVPSGGQS